MMQNQQAIRDLGSIGWPADAALPDLTGGRRLARVIAQHRNGYRVHDGRVESAAQPAPRFLRRGTESSDRPAVGDFVIIGSQSTPLIEQILPRRTQLSRAAAGERHVRQVIATNIDSVFVLMGLDGDFNPRRIERYLALIQGSGARGVVVLTKRDKVDNETIDDAMRQVQSTLPDITLHVINAKDPASVEPLLQFLGAGQTGVLVGSSGAGKSTLTNTLLGSQQQATASVRERDSRGRHTTTHRSLLQLPQGGCLIDTPGMREIKLTGDEELADAGFADIESLALQCRFGDCAHVSEPDCAVRAALEQGTLEVERWQSYQKLRDELAATSEVLEDQLQRKARARETTRALGRRLQDKYGER